MPTLKSWDSRVEAAVLALVGRPYKAETWDPAEGFACWTFVHYVYGLAGVDLPRDIYHASDLFRKVSRPYQPLDVVYMSLKPVLHDHIGVMVNSLELMHASQMHCGVTKSEISRPWFKMTIVEVYRLKELL